MPISCTLSLSLSLSLPFSLSLPSLSLALSHHTGSLTRAAARRHGGMAGTGVGRVADLRQEAEGEVGGGGAELRGAEGEGAQVDERQLHHVRREHQQPRVALRHQFLASASCCTRLYAIFYSSQGKRPRPCYTREAVGRSERRWLVGQGKLTDRASGQISQLSFDIARRQAGTGMAG